MRCIGILCIVLACSGLGMYQAGRLQRDARAHDLLLSLLSECGVYIRTMQTELPELLVLLSEKPAYREFGFLRRAGEQMTPGCMPGTVVCEAIRRDSGIPVAVQETLIRLGSVLGTTDLEGQLAALELARAEISRSGAEAHAKSTVQGRLFRLLGMLGGAMLAVLLM